jgi:hypothetical protein
MKAVGLIVILMLALGGCARAGSEQPQRCFEIDAGAPVDPLLLAFLSRARAAHHLADDLESQGDLAAATAALGGLVTGPLPHENQALAPEVREVLADTRARLADLRSRQGAFEAALADARAGLELVPEPSYFRGHLLETEGLVEERHAKAVAKSDPVASETLRKRAIGLLEQAMAVQSEVIQRASSKPGSSGVRPEFPATSPPPTPAPSSSAAPPQ